MLLLSELDRLSSVLPTWRSLTSCVRPRQLAAVRPALYVASRGAQTPTFFFVVRPRVVGGGPTRRWTKRIKSRSEANNTSLWIGDCRWMAAMLKCLQV